MKIASTFGDKYPTCEWSVFFHHVTESDLSYVYDGYLQVPLPNPQVMTTH